MQSSLHRPTSVTLLIGLVLIIAVGNLIRTLQTIQKWGFLDQQIQISPLFFLSTGILWGTLGFLFVWGLWKRESWSIIWIKWIALLHGLYYWIDRLVLKSSGAWNRNWLFMAIVVLLFLVWIFWMSSRTDVKDYFGV